MEGLATFLLFAVCCLSLSSFPGVFAKDKGAADIYFMHVRSDIRYRFATTTVTSKVANRDSKAKEIFFHLTLPKPAFLTSFSMEIDGKIYPGEVKEKEEAKKQYQKALDRGETGGYIAAKARDSNNFKVSVNIAAEKKVTFKLVYQELLKRRLDMYEHIINIDPGQIVRDMKVQVYIDESREITALSVPPLRKDFQNTIGGDNTGDDKSALINKTSPTSAYIEYRPTAKEQRLASDNGIRGQFVVMYDVQRDLDAGEIQVADGYFVHYFAPKGLPPVSKNVLFILDVSGSMSGNKIKQTKEAMNKVLDDLREGDNFNLITFSTSVSYWKPGRLVPVNKETLRDAKVFVNAMRAQGGTNINAAILKGIHFLEEQDEIGESSLASMMVFLTDGEPTSGVTSFDKIQSNIRQANKGKYSLFSLSFGHGADFPFLQRLSLQNEGLARKIYADSDATLQLEGFYKEISTPVLSNVNITYLDGIADVATITKTNFHCFFDGTEIIVAGKLENDNASQFKSQVSGVSAQGDVILELDMPLREFPIMTPPPHPRSNFTKFTERLWAYMTIKELLRKEKESSNDTIKSDLKKKALDLSLKYSFVTPLTSMVVTKPDKNDTATSGLEDADKEKARPYHHSAQYSIATSNKLSLLSGIPPSLYGGPAPSGPVFDLQAKGIPALPGHHISYGYNSRPGYPMPYPSKKQRHPSPPFTQTSSPPTIPPSTTTTAQPSHSSTTPPSTSTTAAPTGGFIVVRIPSISSVSKLKKIPLCQRLRPTGGDTYTLVYDKKTGIKITAKVSKLAHSEVYFESLFLSKPNSFFIHMGETFVKAGNTTYSYTSGTHTVGYLTQIKMTKRDMMVRIGKRIRIRVRRTFFRTPSGQKAARLFLHGIKGLSRHATGTIGEFRYIKADILQRDGLSTISIKKGKRSNDSCAVTMKTVKDIATGKQLKCFTGRCIPHSW